MSWKPSTKALKAFQALNSQHGSLSALNSSVKDNTKGHMRPVGTNISQNNGVQVRYSACPDTLVSIL